jgi:hypothetical protein
MGSKMTKRISVTPAIVRRLEAVSPTTIIKWDPATGAGSVIFEVWDMVYEDDVYVGMVRNSEVPTIEATIEQLSARSALVNMGGPEPTPLPVLLVSPILKSIFDDLYNETVAGQQESLDRGLLVKNKRVVQQ